MRIAANATTNVPTYDQGYGYIQIFIQFLANILTIIKDFFSEE